MGNKNVKALDNIGDILPRAVDRYYKLITDDGIYTVMADRFYYSSPTPWGYFKQFWSDPVSDINGITVT